MKFLTEQWRNEFDAGMKDTFSAAKTPTKLTISFCETFGAVPQLDGKDYWYLYVIKDGVLEELKSGEGLDNAPSADYVTFATYDTTKKLMTGEMGIAKALLGGKIKLKGNMGKALKLIDTYAIVQELKLLGGKTEW